MSRYVLPVEVRIKGRARHTVTNRARMTMNTLCDNALPGYVGVRHGKTHRASVLEDVRGHKLCCACLVRDAATARAQATMLTGRSARSALCCRGSLW